MVELDGETIVESKPIVGYLHTGMEKTGEELTYVQGGTNVTRMDYLSPLSNELVYSMAVERLLDLELPPRAVWMRMMLVELNRIASHLLFQATNGLDLAATSMMIYGWRERELTLRFLERVTGLRMNNNFIRPGGLAADLGRDEALGRSAAGLGESRGRPQIHLRCDADDADGMTTVVRDARVGRVEVVAHAEVQRELGVSRATAYRMMTDGTLPTYRFGGRNGRRAMVRVSQKDLRAWIDAHRVVSTGGLNRHTC